MPVPPPAGTDLSNPAALETIISQLPFGALAFVMFAWIAGARTMAATSSKPPMVSARLMVVFIAYPPLPFVF